MHGRWFGINLRGVFEMGEKMMKQLIQKKELEDSLRVEFEHDFVRPGETLQEVKPHEIIRIVPADS